MVHCFKSQICLFNSIFCTQSLIDKLVEEGEDSSPVPDAKEGGDESEDPAEDVDSTPETNSVSEQPLADRVAEAEEPTPPAIVEDTDRGL